MSGLTRWQKPGLANAVRVLMSPVQRGKKAAAEAAARARLLQMWSSCRPVESIVAEMAAFGWGKDKVEACLVDCLGDALSLAPQSRPIARALRVLGRRARRAPATPGGYELDGGPATAIFIVLAANRVLRFHGKPPISLGGVGEC